MYRRIIFGCALLLALVQQTWTAEKPQLAAESELRAASAKAIKLIQHSQVVWAQKETCASCHHQLIPEIPMGMARSRAIPFQETVAQNTTAATFAYLKDIDWVVQGYDHIDVMSDGLALMAAKAAGISPSLSTSASAQFIASRQLADGSWRTIDSRPPQSHSPFTATAICVKALRDYLPEQFKAEKETRTRQARQWLLNERPRTTEDRAFQLLGLRWTQADETARKNAARQLLAEQRAEGGWGQLPDLASDAYATGEALLALLEGAGISASDPAYQRGLRFLLKTQQADGSWYVKTRLHPPAPVSPPYFNTEFPYQHDQFISVMGTSWAVAALLHAVPAQAGQAMKQPAQPSLAPVKQDQWLNVALNGSAADLKKLLDAGMKPDAKTAGGTTALMLAARDPEKVKLLLERGADANARATTGITALMVAARYRGNAEVVSLLLKKGAKAKPDKDIEVRNDSSALYFAVMARDAETVKMLIAAGASPADRMKLLGRLDISPLMYATSGNDLSMIETLIGSGASPNETDSDKISVLGWATINNHASAVETLLKLGAKVNPTDNFGMTPLLYAASIDFGDTAVMEKLIAAGADLNAKNKQGLTALDLARNYNYSTMINLLAAKAATR